jgi:hypothetical protein
MARHDIHNPTKARRVIHDGIERSQKQISIEAGATKHGVELDDAVVKQLNDRVAKDTAAGLENTELVVKPASGKTAAPSASASPINNKQENAR